MTKLFNGQARKNLFIYHFTYYFCVRNQIKHFAKCLRTLIWFFAFTFLKHSSCYVTFTAHKWIHFQRIFFPLWIENQTQCDRITHATSILFIIVRNFSAISWKLFKHIVRFTDAIPRIKSIHSDAERRPFKSDLCVSVFETDYFCSKSHIGKQIRPNWLMRCSRPHDDLCWLCHVVCTLTLDNFTHA